MVDGVTALLGKKPITVTAELVALVGAQNAIVLQQVHWWSQESRRSEDGGVVMSLAELGRSTGLSRSALHRSLTWLRENGYVASEGEAGVELRWSLTDQALALDPSTTVAESKRSTVAESRRTVADPKRSPSRDRDSNGVGTTSMGEQLMENGGDAPSGVVAAHSLPGIEPPATRAEPARAGFEEFWRAYPKRDGVKRGKAEAAKEWDRLKAAERVEAMDGLAAYVASSFGKPQDAERYLRKRRWVGVEVDAPLDPPEAGEVVSHRAGPLHVAAEPVVADLEVGVAALRALRGKS